MGTLLREPKKLWRDKSGVAGVEFALVLPFLLVLLLGSAAFFDYFKHRQALDRAVHTAGDILSRQNVLTPTDIAINRRLLVALTPGDNDQLSMRVTSVAMQSGTIYRQWQHLEGPAWQGPAFDESLISEIAEGDSILVVEAFMPDQTGRL